MCLGQICLQKVYEVMSKLMLLKMQLNRGFIPSVAKIIKRNASNDSLKYCTDSVRQYDYENYLSTLLLDKSLATPGIIIRAFNVEIARVRDQVSDEKIAMMRFQFWTDTVDTLFSKNVERVPAHPVAQELYKLNKKNSLSKRNLNRLINSRKTNVSKKFYASIEEMEKYSEESVSPVYYSLLECAGIKDVHADHAVSHLGKAQGLTNMLRSVQALARSRIVLLPQDILMKHNVSQEDVLRCTASQSMKDVVFEVATRAHQHIAKARDIKVPSDAKKILLPTVTVETFLNNLQNKDFSLFDKSLYARNGFLPLILYWNKLRSKY